MFTVRGRGSVTLWIIISQQRMDFLTEIIINTKVHTSQEQYTVYSTKRRKVLELVDKLFAHTVIVILCLHTRYVH